MMAIAAPIFAEAQAAGDDAAQVEEITVTAQRRSENLQRVPVSVTAVTADTLARANITSSTALQQVTPGLTFTSFGRSAFPYIRGIGTPDNSVGNESSVATYVDGIYLESTPSALLELSNVERVEVLKGPQGTLFGRNATGGLVQIITKDPSSTPHGNFEVGYGNYETARTTGYLTGPITSNVSADLGLVYTNQDAGWGRNVTLNRDIDLGKTFAARGKILLSLPTTRVTFGADYTYQGTDVGLSRNLFPGTLGRMSKLSVPPSSAITANPLPGFYDSQSNLFPYSTLRTGGVNLKIEQDLGFAKGISISSYRDTRLQTSFDTDETSASVLEVNIDQRVHAYTQEFQLQSQNSGPFTWIAGLFYMHRKGFQPQETLVGSALPPFFGGRTVIRNGIYTETIAPYAQGTLSLGGGTRLTMGVRYTIEHQKYSGTQATAAGNIVSAPPSVPSVNYRSPTWRLALDHEFNPGLMAYVSYNRGFKSGVYNANAAADPPVQPEIVDATEVGFKSQFLDNRLRFNAAGYWYEYKNIQLNVATGNPASPTRALNAGKARILGVEASIDAVPLPGLTLSAGVNYMPVAKYVTFLGAPFFEPNFTYGANTGPTPTNDSGGRMLRAPEYTATFSGSYEFSAPGGDVDVGLNVYYSSAFLWNVDDRDLGGHLRARYQQKNYTTVNGQVAYRSDAGWRVTLWTRNLFDEKYMSSVSETGTGDVYSPAAPRTYGIKIGYEF